MVLPIAPRLQACAACYYRKQCESKSSSRENDAFETYSKHETYEAAAGVTQHTLLQ